MAENNVDVIATIRLRANQLRADASVVKKEFKDVKAEAEKPTQVAIKTDAAQAEVKKLDKALQDVQRRADSLGAKLGVPGGGSSGGGGAQSLAASMGFDFAGSRARLAAAQAQLDIAKKTRAELGDGGSNGGNINSVLRTIVAVEAVVSSIEVGLSAAKLTTAIIAGDATAIAAAAKDMEVSIRAIPIIGDRIADLGAKINEAFTGAAAAARAIAEQGQLAGKAIDEQRAAVEATNDALKEQQDIIDELLRRRNMLGKTGTDRQQAQADEQAVDDRVRIAAKAEADIEKIRERGRRALEYRQQALRRQQEYLDSLGDKTNVTPGMLNDPDTAVGAARLQEKNAEIDRATQARDAANRRLLEAERLMNEQIAQVNAKKNETIVEADKTAAATREQIDKDALDRRTAKEREAIRRMTEFEIKEAEQVAKEKERIEEEARKKREKDAEDLEKRSSKEREAVRRMNEEVKKMEERAAKEREDRARRNTGFTTTRALMERMQIGAAVQSSIDGTLGKGDRNARQPGESLTSWRRRTGGVETVTDRVRANLQDFHANRGGTQGASDDVPKKSLSTLEKIEENTRAKAGNTLEIITD